MTRSAFNSRDRDLGIAEIDGDYRNTSSAGHIDVVRGIPDHDGAVRLTARPFERPAQQLRVGLFQPERVGAANGREAFREAERIEQPHRQPFELVGAYDQRQTAAPAISSSAASSPGERPRAVGDVRRIMLDEVPA